MDIPTEHTTSPFDQNTFSTQVGEKLTAYKKTWVSSNGVTMGPTYVSPQVKPMLTQEVLDANKPEEDALADLVESTAEGIVSAFEVCQHEAAILEAGRVISQNIMTGLLAEKFTREILQEIFIETLSLLSPGKK